MKTIQLFTAWTLVIAPLCCLAGSRDAITRDDLAAVQQRLCGAAEFTVINSLAELPPPLRARMKGTADRGEPYNETDRFDGSIPFQRFIIGAANDKLMLFAIEVGGFAPSKHLDAYLQQDGNWVRLPRLPTDWKNYGNLPLLLAEARHVFHCESAAAGN
jgi:hypothetical protein